MSKPKVLLIGWDAADWKLIHPLLDAGAMPTLARFLSDGTMGNLATLKPDLSPMLWTSIATGKRPFKHGVHGFSEPDPISGGIRPVTNLSRHTKALWNILQQKGLRSNVIGWWPSHPAEPIDGVMVSNHFQRANAPIDHWPIQPGTIHPPEWIEPLKALRVHPSELGQAAIEPFVPRWREVDQDKDKRLESLAKVIADTATIQAAATALMQNTDWDLTAVYFDGIDHVCHGFMKYHPPRRPWIPEQDFDIYQDVVAGIYRFHDMLLGTLLTLAGEDTTVILISDHGFHPDDLRPEHIPLEPAGPAAEHRKFGIFAARGPGIRRDQNVFGASVLDICPTILSMFGLPIGEDMDGRPLLDLFEQVPEITTTPSWDKVAGDAGTHPPDQQITPADSKAALDQLVALGYIDEPNADQGKAREDTVRELDYNLAQSYMDAGRFADAEMILERLYAAWPEEYRFGIQLALCYKAIGRVTALRELVGGIILHRKEEAVAARTELAAEGRKAKQQTTEKTSDEQAQRKLAKRLHDLSAKANLNLTAMHQLEAWADMAERRYAEALQTLDAAEQAMTPADVQSEEEVIRRPDFHNLRGEILLKLRRWDEAEGAFKTALSLDAESPGALLGRARANLGRRRYGTACDHALASIGLLYHQPRAHYLLGLACYRNGDMLHAEQAWRIASRQDPGHAAAWRMLAEIRLHVHDDPHGATQMRVRARMARERQRAFVAGQRTGQTSETVEPMRNAPTQQTTLRPIGQALFSNLPMDRAGEILIVSGLPRSGTSMTMQMLQAGGFTLLSDGRRLADAANPKGYLEHEAVKSLRHDSAWLGKACGKAVKVVAPLLPFLPLKGNQGQTLRYRVLMMERDLDEIMASQQRMLGQDKDVMSDPGKVYAMQLEQAYSLLERRAIPTLILPYAAVIGDPKSWSQTLNNFLDGTLDVDKMCQSVDARLYRERADRWQQNNGMQGRDPNSAPSLKTKSTGAITL